MIVDCPYCNTSNSESDYATGADGTVVCRSCARQFKAPQQAKDVGSNTTQVAHHVLEERERTDAAGPPAPTPLPTGDTPTRMAGVPLPDASDAPTRVGQAPSAPAEPQEQVTVVRASPVSASLPEDTPAPRPEGTGKTGVMSQQQLYRALIESESIEPDEMGAELPQPGETRTMAVPRGGRLRPWAMAARRQALALWNLFLQQPRPVRIGATVGAVLVLFLLILSIRLATRSSVSTAYAADIQALLSAPVEGARPLGNLRRGEQVTVFDAVGDLVMVRDLQGRVGYVQEVDLLKERPASPPDSPFVDCKPAAAERDMHGCEDRAEEQWESCLGLCEKANALSKCNDDCRGQYRVCLAACHGEAVHPEPGLPSALPPLPPPAPAPTPTPAAAPTRLAAPAPPRTESAPSHGSKPKSSKKTEKKHKR